MYIVKNEVIEKNIIRGWEPCVWYPTVYVWGYPLEVLF